MASDELYSDGNSTLIAYKYLAIRDKSVNLLKQKKEG